MLDLPILPGHGPRCVRSCQMVKGDDTDVPESPRMVKVEFLGSRQKMIQFCTAFPTVSGVDCLGVAVARGTPPALGNYPLRSGSVPRGSQYNSMVFHTRACIVSVRLVLPANTILPKCKASPTGITARHRICQPIREGTGQWY